jgi:hypothetical protein
MAHSRPKPATRRQRETDQAEQSANEAGGRHSPGDGVGVGVDDLVGDALVEVAQDLDERARQPGCLVERHHVVGGGHALPQPALQLRHHGRRPRPQSAPRRPSPRRGGGEGRRRRGERERGRLHALRPGLVGWWLRATGSV